ncbi:MAG: glycoside hydrolase family 28 protein [Bacteroidales bacterium]|nr:glycoside hydrolase family 28 protein [Bacteroidales bacterium]
MKKLPSVLYFSSLFILLLTGCNDNRTEVTAPEGSRFEVSLPDIPDAEFLITDYGAVNDGLTLNTEAINKTIEACHESGGGKVIIPEGVWITGPIQLKNNINLHAAEGAVVLFSRNFDEYPFVLSYYEGRRDFRAMPLIYGDSLTNIAITGKGIFDGSGDAWRPVKKMKMTNSQWLELVNSGGALNEQGDIWWPNEYAYEASKDPDRIREQLADDPERDKYKAFYRPYLVQLISCDRVMLEGPLFQNSPGWCIHPLMCTNLTVNDITVRNPWYSQNGDGIDVESCKYVTIKNSSFDVGDDAICVKSGKNKEGRERGMPTRFVEVDNCIVHHGHGGFVVGSEMSGGVSDIWVRNCSFTGTDVGLRFKTTRGRGGVVENIHIENIRMIDIDRDAIIFNMFYAGLAPTEMGENPIEGLIANAPEVSEETPVFRNINITNVNCQGAASALNIIGLPEMPVSGLSISHSVFSTEDGIRCLFASDLSLENVTVVTAGQPTMNFMNVAGAAITSVSGNNEVLLNADGSRTKDIRITTDNPEKAKSMTVIGDEADKGAVTFSEI